MRPRMARDAVLDDTGITAFCSVGLAGTEGLLANELLRCARGDEAD